MNKRNMSYFYRAAFMIMPQGPDRYRGRGHHIAMVEFPLGKYPHIPTEEEFKEITTQAISTVQEGDLIALVSGIIMEMEEGTPTLTAWPYDIAKLNLPNIKVSSGFNLDKEQTVLERKNWDLEENTPVESKRKTRLCAIFTGENSLGYVNDEAYDIYIMSSSKYLDGVRIEPIFEDNPRISMIGKSQDPVEYETLHAFFKNWDSIDVIKENGTTSHDETPTQKVN